MSESIIDHGLSSKAVRSLEKVPEALSGFFERSDILGTSILNLLEYLIDLPDDLSTLSIMGLSG